MKLLELLAAFPSYFAYIEKIIVNATPNPIYATILFFFTNVLIIVGMIAISNVEYIDDVLPDSAVYILNDIKIKVE